MEINNERIKKNLETFSFPRLSGTEYEKKAFNLAKAQIEALGLNPNVQTFNFSTFYSRVYPKISFPIVFLIILGFYFNFILPFFLFSLSFSFIIFFPFFLLTRKPEKIRLGKILESQNLFVKLSVNPDIQSDKIYNTFFIAHLDSKGQRITVRTRGISIFIFTITLLSNIVILTLRFFFSSFYILFTAIGVFPLIVLLIAVVILSTNTTNNKSKGVVDDASGVVCVLELLHSFSMINPSQRKCNLWFVLTGAEESGTMGIRFFYDYIKEIKRTRAIIHNFESLGKTINIVVTKNSLENVPNYYNLIQKQVKDNGFNLFINPFTRGIHTDGMYLARKNFSLFEYGSSEVGKYMHSTTDSLKNVDTDMLAELCEFIKTSIITNFYSS